MTDLQRLLLMFHTRIICFVPRAFEIEACKISFVRAEFVDRYNVSLAIQSLDRHFWKILSYVAFTER